MTKATETHSSSYNGTYGSVFRLYVTANEVDVDTANNRSNVEVYAWMQVVSHDHGTIYNNNATSGYDTVNGVRTNGSISRYSNQDAIGTKYYLISSDNVWVTHNSDGSKSITVTAYHNASNSYVGTASVSFTYDLSQIDRYAGVSTFSAQNISDVGWQTTVGTDATCDYLDYALDGGSWTRVMDNVNFTSKSFSVGGRLSSGRPHTIQVKVRRADSGLWTTSSTKTVTTLPQNNLFLVGVV